MNIFNVFFNLMHSLLGDGMPYHAAMALLGFILTLMAGKAIKVFLNTAVRRVIANTDSELDDKILKIIVSRIMAVTAITGAYVGIHELRNGIGPYQSAVHIMIDNVNAILFVLSAIIITLLVIRIASTVLVHTMRAYSMKNDASLHRALTPLINRVVMFMITALAIIVVMDHFGQNVNSLLTLLGAGSLAIGLAAQDTISNMISGFVIMIDRPFQIGDRIKIPSGEEGDVHEIGMRSTTILDSDYNLIVVPNNDLIRTRIVNYSYPTPEHSVVVEVNAAFGTDVQRMKDILITVALANSEVMAEPVPEAFLVNITNSSMQYKLICRVKTYTRKFAVAEQLRVAIYTTMVEANMEVSLPQYVVKLKDTLLPPLS